MPALAYSQSIQRRVASVGFDWDKPEGIIDKLAEEVDEFRQASSWDEKNREFGDVLFTLANIARRLEIDLETALRAANQRFCDRFSHMELICSERDIRLSDLSLDEQNALWNEAKQRV
jgi:tetrapyrrole methylase family protein/MazG family protein